MYGYLLSKEFLPMIAAWLSFTALMCLCVGYYYYRRKNASAFERWNRHHPGQSVEMTATNQMHSNNKWQVHEVEAPDPHDPHRHASVMTGYNVYDNSRRTSHLEANNTYAHDPHLNTHHPQVHHLPFPTASDDPHRHASLMAGYNVYDNERRSSHLEGQNAFANDSHLQPHHSHSHPHPHLDRQSQPQPPSRNQSTDDPSRHPSLAGNYNVYEVEDRPSHFELTNESNSSFNDKDT